MEFGAASNRVFGIPQCYRLRPSSSSCSVIPSWRVLFDTLGSRLMTHWKYQNRLRSSIGNVGRTPSPLIGLVRPLSGKMPYACSRPRAEILARDPTVSCSANKADAPECQGKVEQFTGATHISSGRSDCLLNPG